MTTVGQLIVETLAAHRIDRVFCVPGESYLGLLDAFYGRSDIDLVVCRHEAGAGFMALADARLTGRPGVAMVSRGPGASNAAIAVHTAQQDAEPFILFIGQVASQDVRRDSFQEIDYSHMFGRIAKWTAEVTDPGRMAETLLRAIQVATTGLPGPVVIAIPEDVLTSDCTAQAVLPQARPAAAPDAASVEQIRALLSAAQRPLVLAGRGIGTMAARADLLAFLEAWNVPSIVSFRCQDLLPNAHPLYAGDMGLSNPDSQMAVLRDCDLLLCAGACLSDITTQNYTYPRPVRPQMTFIHIHSDPGVMGTHFACDIALACNPSVAFAAIGEPSCSLPDRAGWIRRLSEERRKITAVRNIVPSDGVSFETVADLVGRHLPKDAIVTVDAGTFGAPVYRVIPFTPPQRLLAPVSGAMGFGVPAAVAAGLREPDRTVVCFVGDGGFLMTGSELAVALARKLPLKIILSENGMYASIRIQQERQFPGRNVGTSFVNPDFELIGKAYGFPVTQISSTSQLGLIPDLLCSRNPELVVVRTSVEAILRH
jgi:acetolactate synthase I/II/III large subunit